MNMKIFWEKVLRIIKDDIMFYGSRGSFEPRFRGGLNKYHSL